MNRLGRLEAGGRHLSRRRLLGNGAHLSVGVAAFGMLSSACQALPGRPSSRLPRLGYLGGGPRDALLDLIDPFLQGLHDLGHVEGQSIEINWRFGTGGVGNEYSALAAELLALPVDVIVVGGGEVTPATQAVMQVTTTIPVLAVNANDPVGTGLVASIAQPSGNVTALTGLPFDHGKYVELLIEVVPGLGRVAHLYDATSASAVVTWREVQTAAAAAGVQVQRIDLQAASDLESAFITPDITRAEALINGATALLRPVRVRLAELALQQRLPSMGGVGEYARTGLLMTYGTDLTVMFRNAATYVDKLLKGAKPADLPVEQATGLELLVNVKTLQALGLTIPPTVIPLVTGWV